MIKNYLKVSLRSILRDKTYSFINILGLSIGMACCILMLLWIQHETSYDLFNENIEDLYRVIRKEKKGDKILEQWRTPAPLGPALKKDFPEVLNHTRFILINGIWVFKVDNKTFNGVKVALVDPSFFKMFNYPFVHGHPKKAFSNLNSIVITQNMREKYFSDNSPIGKNIQLIGENYLVTGIIKNIPSNSHLKFDCAIPFEIIGKKMKQIFSWDQSGYATYIQLQDNIDKDFFNKKIANYLDKYIPDSDTELYLQAVKKIHLFSNFQKEYAETENIKYVYILYALAILMLLSACLNFMNLATARSKIHAKEVGIRKVIGASRIDAIKQFWGIANLFAFIAIFIAIYIASIFLPIFNQLSGKELSLFFPGLVRVIFMLFGVMIVTGILSGAYPALYLSSFQPIGIVQGIKSSKQNKALFRKILVLGQFTLSIFLIIANLYIYQQISYIRNKNLGFNKDNLVVILALGNLDSNYDSYKDEMLKNPNILSVARGFLPIWMEIQNINPDWEGKNKDKKVLMQCFNVDYDYFKTLQMQVKLGRTFSKKFPEDSNQAYIVNETAVNAMGMNSPIGKKLIVENKEGKIIGVVKDFHHCSLHQKIGPIVFRIGYASAISIRLIPEPKINQEMIKFLKDIWKKADTGEPFELEILSHTIEKFYKKEKKLMRFFNYFTLLTIFITCLGLLGLSSFLVEQRTKEIGVRKVLGATFSNIVFLLVRDYINFVLLANIIAWPAAYIVLNNWILQFAYHTHIGLWIFIVAMLIGFLITLLTVFYNAIKSARRNPIEALRFE